MSSEAEYQIPDIKVDESVKTEISYQFPKPNLIVKFENGWGKTWSTRVDVLLCSAEDAGPYTGGGSYQLLNERKISQETGNCFLSTASDKNGIFQIYEGPGKYFMFFKVHPAWGAPDDPTVYAYEIADIYIQAGLQATEIDLQLK